jgi:membrane protease YdiL (CAAX protease family)
VPVANVVLLVRDLFIDKLELGPFLICIGSTACFALLALWGAVALFEREEVLFREVGARTMTWRPRHTTPVVPVAGALLAGALALIVFVYGGQRIAWALGMERVMLGVLAGQGLLLLVTLAVLTYYRAQWDTALALRWPGTLPLLHALVAGTCGALVMMQVQPWLIDSFPRFKEAAEQMAKLLAPLLQQPLWVQLTVLALCPAIVEELLCRGLILQSLAKHGQRIVALVISAAIFAVLHLDPTRYLPTFVMGLLAGWMVLRTQSLLAGVAMHLAWNGTLITVMYGFGKLDPSRLAAWEGYTSCIALGGALTLVAVLYAFHRATRTPAALHD